MTKKEIAESHLSILDDGSIALTTDKNGGRVNVVRIITNDEVLNLMTMIYLIHSEKNPGIPLQVIPINDEQSMVLTILNSDQLKRTE